MTPREFCQEQLLLLGDEALQPSAEVATLDILHGTIMKDPDGATFEATLRRRALAQPENGRPSADARVARVLLDAWLSA